MFRVKATGNGLLFQWQKNQRDLSVDDRYCETNTDTLHILEVENSDKGRYRCHIKNDLREKFSKEAVLTVSKLIIVVDVMCLTSWLNLPSSFSFMYDVGNKILILFYLNSVTPKYSLSSTPPKNCYN